MSVPGDFASVIRILRRELGLTQPEFAGLFPVSPITISRWENGQNEPTDQTWRRVEELDKQRKASVGTVGKGPELSQLDFGASPEAVAAVAEAVRLTNGHVASPTFATEISLIDPCLTSALPSTTTSSSLDPSASCSPTTPVRARPLWPG